MGEEKNSRKHTTDSVQCISKKKPPLERFEPRQEDAAAEAAAAGHINHRYACFQAWPRRLVEPGREGPTRDKLFEGC